MPASRAATRSLFLGDPAHGRAVARRMGARDRPVRRRARHHGRAARDPGGGAVTRAPARRPDALASQHRPGARDRRARRADARRQGRRLRPRPRARRARAPRQAGVTLVRRVRRAHRRRRARRRSATTPASSRGSRRRATTSTPPSPRASTSASATPRFSRSVADAAADAGATPRVHLKIDTGLHRNGVRPEDWAAFVARAAELQSAGLIDVVGVWSHIAEASDAEDDDAPRRVRRGAARRPRPPASDPPSVTSPPARRRSRGRSSATTSCGSGRSATASARPAGRPRTSSGSSRSPRLEADVVAVHRRRRPGRHRRAATDCRRRCGAVGPGRHARGRPTARVVAESHSARRGVARRAPSATPSRCSARGRAAKGPATDLAETIGTIGEEIAVRVSPLVPRVYT